MKVKISSNAYSDALVFSLCPCWISSISCSLYSNVYALAAEWYSIDFDVKVCMRSWTSIFCIRDGALRKERKHRNKKKNENTNTGIAKSKEIFWIGFGESSHAKQMLRKIGYYEKQPKPCLLTTTTNRRRKRRRKKAHANKCVRLKCVFIYKICELLKLIW